MRGGGARHESEDWAGFFFCASLPSVYDTLGKGGAHV